MIKQEIYMEKIQGFKIHNFHRERLSKVYNLIGFREISLKSHTSVVSQLTLKK